MIVKRRIDFRNQLDSELICRIAEQTPEQDYYKVFDWIGAAELLRDLKKSLGEDYKEVTVDAGLAEDYGYTAGKIIKNGKIPNDARHDCYLGSIWATPYFVISYEDDSDMWDKYYECWVDAPINQQMNLPGVSFYSDSVWNEKTFWPEIAREIYEEVST